jgi:hypothetical protein
MNLVHTVFFFILHGARCSGPGPLVHSLFRPMRPARQYRARRFA